MNAKVAKNLRKLTNFHPRDTRKYTTKFVEKYVSIVKIQNGIPVVSKEKILRKIIINHPDGNRKKYLDAKRNV